MVDQRWQMLARRSGAVAKDVRSFATAVVEAILIVTCGVQVVRVDGFSMAPTLENRDRLIVDKFIYTFSDPRPGDIVTLYYPPDPHSLFVKRLIATEGDTVQIVDGRVTVNGNLLQDDYVIPVYRDHDNWGPETIEQGYDFVMGDHRNRSLDSRHWGLVPKKYIVGKVMLRWWPVQDMKLF